MLILNKCSICDDSLRTRKVDVYANDNPIDICRPCLMRFIGHAQDSQTVMLIEAIKWEDEK